MLRKLGTLPEQSHAKIRKILGGTKNNMFQIRVDDLAMLLEMWFRGEHLEDMFLALPILQRSTKKPPIEEWMAGLEQPSVWDDDFDKFCDAIHLVFHRYLAWLMSACEQLARVAGGWAETTDWASLSLFLEYGVDSHWAVKVLKVDITGERRPVATLGRALPSDWFSEADPIGLQSIRISKTKRSAFENVVRQCISDVGGMGTEQGQELEYLRSQIFQAAGIASS
jgi:hypothetical protein